MRAAALVLLVAACAGPPPGPDDPDPVFSQAERGHLAGLAPPALPAPPPDVSNRFADDPRAALFGRRLFFDAAFSGRLLDSDNDGGNATLGMQGDTGAVSCAGCHVPAAGFLDDRTRGRQISLASGWVLRRTPSLLDVAQAKLLMWDGRFDTLHGQIFGPLESTLEMNSSRLFAAQEIARRHAAEYEAIFGPLPPLTDPARFPQLDARNTGCDVMPGTCHGKPRDGAEYDHLPPADQDAVTLVVANAGKAIAAYERLLACGPGRFDAWIHGETAALSRAEQRGAALFAGKAGCISCHSGAFLTDQQFHNVGLEPVMVAGQFIDRDDRGAALGWARLLADPLNVSGRWSDGDDGRLPSQPGPAQEGAFRTPSLRCAARRPSFMHTGQLRTLESVVAFFDRGGHSKGFPGTSEIRPLQLSERERSDLSAFLRTLEGSGPPPELLSPP